MKKLFPLVFGLALLGAGCGASQVARTNEVPADTLPREFDFDQVHVGDRVVGLAVEKIEPSAGGQALSADNVAITFSGDKQVTGELVVSGMSGLHCVQLEAASAQSMPQLRGGASADEFCFNPSPTADAILKGREQKKITITIEHYKTGLVEGGERYNLADLKL